MVELACPAIDRRRLYRASSRGNLRVVPRDLLPGCEVELARDPFHLGIAARAGGEVLELSDGVTGVEPGDPRHEVSVALALKTVTRATRGRRAGAPAAEGDKLAGALEGIACGNGRPAGGRAEQRERDEKRVAVHPACKPTAARRGSTRVLAFAALLAGPALAGCKQPPSERYAFADDTVARGRALVQATGCTACHAFPDIEWPQGRAGPSLERFDGYGPIAGVLPNTPANLASFVRNAPAAKPGSPMPAMPLRAREARDVAAYLYSAADGR